MSRTLSSIINFRSFWTEGAEWRHFAKVLLLVISTPVILSCLLAKFAAWKMGDTIPFEEVALAQAKNPKLLYMPTRDVNVARYKLARVAQERPDILLMGESRGMSFRAAMFAPYSCYNLSVPASTMDAQLALLNRLPEGYKPKAVFLNLDFFVLDSSYAGIHAKYATPNLEARPWTDYFEALHDSYLNLLTHPESISPRSHDPLYGLPSIGSRPAYSSYGMRSDGSFTLYANQLEEAGTTPPNFDVFVKNPNMPLYPADHLDAFEVSKFEKFVRLTQDKGIALVCFQPPVFGPILREVRQTSRYRLLEDFEARAKQGYFDRLGVTFFDFIQFPPWSENSAYFMDPFHPLEVLDAEMVLKMSEDSRVKAILPNFDTAALQRQLDGNAQADRHLFLYPY
jgi:hypothetical protein